jgi:uncharacterized protein involved in propanediol utilization
LPIPGPQSFPERKSRPGPLSRTVSGHLGELLQGRLGPDGPLVLVTLPAPPLQVAAAWSPGPFALHAPGPRPIDRPQAAALWRALGGGHPKGRLILRAGMPPGGGAGSSTAALIATARVCAAALGLPEPEPERLARLCLALEGATDPLTFPDPARRLWTPREGRTLALLPPLPALEVVGGFLGPGRRTDPADLDFADVADLAAAWAPAAARGDLAALAALATASARRNQARRGGPDLAPLEAAAARLGALGLAAAHTGAARGLLFAPGCGDPHRAEEALRALGLRNLCRFRLAAPVSGR